jgi:haloalkane dehalogenase
MSLGTVVTGALSGCKRALAPVTSKRPAGLKSITASEYQATRKFVRISHGSIAYMDRGKGPAALFLHGFPLNSFQWRGVLNELSAQRRCIAPDFLGLGYTEVAEGQSVAPTAQANMLAALLDTLSIPSVDIVANDSGGAVAQLFVVQYPKRIRTLLLTNCDTEPDSPPPAVLPAIAAAREGKFADEWLAPWLADKGLARSKKGIGGIAYSDPTHPTDEAIDYYFTPLLSSSQQKTQVNAYAIALSPNPLAGIEPVLEQCSVPTRIVWGTADDIFSSASPDYLDRTLGNSRGVRHVPGAKLFFPEEMPELIAGEVQALWRT